MEKKIPIVPYKELGLFCGTAKPKYYEIDKLAYLAVPTKKSYKIFTLPNLKVRFLGPTLESEITAVEAYNELLYISVGTKVKIFHFLHLVDEIEFNSNVQSLLLYSTNLIAALESGEIHVIDVMSKKEISRLYVDFDILDMFHPETYLNKILVAGEGQLELWNVMTGNRIFSFDKNKHFAKYFQEKKLTCLELAPAVDFAAVGFDDGSILVFNMKKSKILQKFTQKLRVENLAFSQNLKNQPLLASSDSKGNIFYWNLNDERLERSQSQCHSTGKINYLQYLNFSDEDMLVSGSEEDNSLKLWWKQDKNDMDYSLLRVRQGCRNQLRKIQFYGKDSRHIIGFSSSRTAEIFDFSVLREEMTIQLSNKKFKKIGSVTDIDFSLARERFWSNMLTANVGSTRPTMYDVPNRTIVKKKIETFDKYKANRRQWIKDLSLKKRFITAVNVSVCGNFGLAGYNDGYIVKIDMQAGMHVKTFFNRRVHQNLKIIGLFSDPLNHFMISADDHVIARWDYYSGLFKDKLDMKNEIDQIFANSSKNSSLFGVSDKLNNLSLVDYSQLKEIRTFNLRNSRITDCAILLKEKKIVTTHEDKTLKIWDIFSEQLIFTLQLEKVVQSLTCNFEGTILATIFEGENGIKLWNVGKLTLFEKSAIEVNYATPVKFRGKDKRKFYFEENEEDKEGEVGDISNELFNEIKQYLDTKDNKEKESSNNNLIKFTSIPINRWMPLKDIDEIEERNKPIEAEKIDVPFFLEFDNPLTRIKQETEGEVMEKEKGYVSKVIKKEKKLEYLDNLNLDFMKELEKIKIAGAFNKENRKTMIKAFKILKSQTASKMNYLLKQVCFEGGEGVTKLLMLFNLMFKSSSEFDIKCLLFNALMKEGYDKVYESDKHKLLLDDIQAKVKGYKDKINDDYLYINCLINKFSV